MLLTTDSNRWKRYKYSLFLVRASSSLGSSPSPLFLLISSVIWAKR